MSTTIVAAAFRRMIQRHGTNFTLTPVQGQASTVRGSFVDASTDDLPLINSYGFEARVMRMDVAAGTIAKFDRLTDPGGSRYTVHAAHPVYAGNVWCGLKLYVEQA